MLLIVIEIIPLFILFVNIYIGHFAVNKLIFTYVN